MRRPVLAALTVVSLAHAAFAQTAPAPAAGTPLIERTKLFGNPSKMAGNVSPDGKWLSWIAPRDSVLDVWAAPIDAPGNAKALTDEKTRPIRAAFRAPDSKTLLFINDKGGYARAIADKQLNVRVLARARTDGGIDYYRTAGGKVDATPFVQVGLDDALTTGPLGFATDGKTLYRADSRGRDTAAL